MRPSRDARLAVQAEQLRHRRPVDVGVEDADGEAERLQPEGKVAGGGRLADPALAGRHRDHVPDAGDELRLGGRRARRPAGRHRRRRRRAARHRPVCRQADEHGAGAGEGAHGAFGRLPDGLEGGGLARLDGDREHDAAAIDENLGQAPGSDEALPVAEPNRRERLQDLFTARGQGNLCTGNGDISLM